MPPPPSRDREDRVRAALLRARLLTNRTPHLATQTRRDANTAIDILEGQLGLNQTDVIEATRAVELLNGAYPSLIFGLLRDQDFAERFSPALRRLGLRGISQRLEEVSGNSMAEPIPGPTGERHHRDELAPDERVDALGRPLPPPPGYY